jgi:hypothetical protein
MGEYRYKCTGTDQLRRHADGLQYGNDKSLMRQAADLIDEQAARIATLEADLERVTRERDEWRAQARFRLRLLRQGERVPPVVIEDEVVAQAGLVKRRSQRPSALDSDGDFRDDILTPEDTPQ